MTGAKEPFCGYVTPPGSNESRNIPGYISVRPGAYATDW